MQKSTHVGRHIKKMTVATAFATAKYRRGKQTITCGRCPKWKSGFCPIQAKFMLKEHMACNYGKTLFRAKRQRERWGKEKS